MARDTNLNINVTADNNRASDELRKVAAEVKALEDGVDVPLSADDQASDDIDQVADKAQALDGTTATVDVAADDNATADLDRVEAKARDLDGRTARVTAEADVDQAIGDLDRIEAKLRDLDGRRAGLGVGGAAAAGAAAGAVAGEGIPVVGEFARGAQEAAGFAVQVQVLATQTGSTFEQASRLASVWRNAGFDLTDLLDILANINQVVRDNPDLTEQLGLSKANDTVTTLLQALERIAAIESPGERTALRSQLFGEEGLRQVGQVEVLVGDIRTAMRELDGSQITQPGDVDRARELSELSAKMATRWQEIQLHALRFADTLIGLPSKIAEPDISGTDIVRALTPFGNPQPSTLLPLGLAPITGAIARAAAGISQQTGGQHFTINPPGTPSAANQQQQQHLARNGVRLS